jgi:hypothetical protein
MSVTRALVRLTAIVATAVVAVVVIVPHIASRIIVRLPVAVIIVLVSVEDVTIATSTTSA